MSLSYEAYQLATDRKYEREIHIEALERLIDLAPIQLYTSDASTFLSASVKKILNEYTSEERPNIIVTGHSLGRFLAGYAFLDYAGEHSTEESALVLDGINIFNNIGFNGPAGFQGLPHLPFMKDQRAQGHITTALSVLDHNNGGIMQHVRRTHDLVGSLGHEMDIAQIYEIPDVENSENVSAQEHFLNNHSIKAITSQLHK